MHRLSHLHRVSPINHGLEKANNLTSLALYQCLGAHPPHAALPGPLQDAIVLAVKSLPSQTLVNLAMIGTSVQPLFQESRACSDVSVGQGFGYLVEMFQPIWVQPETSVSRTPCT